jgi:hypothetical protein
VLVLTDWTSMATEALVGQLHDISAGSNGLPAIDIEVN